MRLPGGRQRGGEPGAFHTQLIVECPRLIGLMLSDLWMPCRFCTGAGSLYLILVQMNVLPLLFLFFMDRIMVFLLVCEIFWGVLACYLGLLRFSWVFFLCL